MALGFGESRRGGGTPISDRRRTERSGPIEHTPFSADTPPHWHVTFSVADAHATAKRAAELGGEVVTPPTDMPWVRIATLRDPQGTAFTIGEFQPPE